MNSNEQYILMKDSQRFENVLGRSIICYYRAPVNDMAILWYFFENLIFIIYIFDSLFFFIYKNDFVKTTRLKKH